MKKRLACLFLGILMVLSVAFGAVGCSSKSDEEAEQNITDAASASAVTLTMWVVSEKKVSTAVADSVNEALNSLSKSKLKTQLIVHFLTQDEYENELSKTIKQYESIDHSAKEEEVIEEGDETEAQEDETRRNSKGLVEIVYPEVEEAQVDIVTILGEEMYLDFIEKGWLAALDGYLSGSANKKIKEYIPSALLSAAKYNGKTYAVPNNNIIGDYTYLLLNKKLMDTYSYGASATEGKIDSFFNDYVYNYLDAVEQYETDKSNLVMIDGSYEDCLNLLAYYWGVDPADYSATKDFSVFGTYYPNMLSVSRGKTVLKYENLFANKQFTDGYLKLNEFANKNYFGTAAEGKQAAAKIVKCDLRELTQYTDEYYPVIVSYPTMTDETVYGNMFGVYSGSRNAERAAEVITYLNTNEDFRNTLMYGPSDTYMTKEVKLNGKSYKVAYDINEEYQMDIAKTGNAFLVYPVLDQMDADIWEKAKIQNSEALIDPLLGFDIKSITSSGSSSTASTGNITLNTNEYLMEYASGYSKEVLSENAEVAAWLKNADASGNGIYLFKASETVENTKDSDKSYIIYNCILYNKGIASDSTLVLNENTDTKFVSVKAEDGTITSKLDLHFSTEYTAGEGAEGYLLTLITLYFKVNDDAFDFKIGDADAAKSVTEGTALPGYDFMNTDLYSIDVSRKLNLPELLKNTVLSPVEGSNGWLDTILTNGKNSALSADNAYVLTYSEKKDDQTVYTYVLYHPNEKLKSTLSVVPTGDKENMSLAFVFGDDGSTGIGKDPAYSLYYVTVTVDNDVTLTTPKFFKQTANTEGFTMTALKGAETVSKNDPSFNLCGNLDTDLTKYLYQLNGELVALLNENRSDNAKLKAVAAEIAELLNPDSEKTTAEDFTELKEYIGSTTGAVNGDLDTLREYLTLAYSAQASGSEETWGDDKLPYASLYSPFGIYSGWITEAGYVVK